MSDYRPQAYGQGSYGGSVQKGSDQPKTQQQDQDEEENYKPRPFKGKGVGKRAYDNIFAGWVKGEDGG